jgi:uncharacterized heparinase superfamily protein
MTLGHFNRLTQMTLDEYAWRARVVARTTADRFHVRLRAPRWDREDLQYALAAPVMDTEMRSAIARKDWDAVHDSLAHRLRHREGRCALDPAAARDVRDAVLSRWPSAAEDAAARAGRILDGRYDLLGYRSLTFALAPSNHRTGVSSVDWHFDPVHRRRAPQKCWADVPYMDSSVGDHKIIWELNRHQHWLQLGRASWLTGQSRYAVAIIEQLGQWLAANPPLVGMNWASMLEIGLRTISWTWALQFLLADVHDERDDVRRTPWLVDMLVALDRQLTHVEQHLSYYFSPNTHLTGEALALYVVGHALPELAASDRWRATGRRILLQEIDRQILADGGHAERSTHYQRYTLDFYLLALLTAQRGGDAEAVSRFADASARLAEFTRTMADDHGRLPLIGDDDGGMLWPITGRECHDVRDSLAVAAVVLERSDLAPWGVPEEAFWVASSMTIERAPAIEHARPDPTAWPSRTLPDTGYVVLHDAAGGHSVFDVGGHGYMNGGHAHADALSLTISVAHRPLLVDPGTSTYTMDRRLRDRMRGTANHNTVTVDGRPQSKPAGPFQWGTTANGRLHASRHNAGFDWAEASHDGYSPIEHRRSIVRADGAGWLVVDEIVTALAEASTHDRGDRHSAATHWHFDPGWTLKADAPGRLRATHVQGDEAWVLNDAGDLLLTYGDDESGLGWFAPVYGTLVPTWTARVTREGVAPLSLLAWIGAAAETAHGAPSLERIAATADPAGRVIAARIVAGDVSSVFLLRPGEPSWRESRTCTVGEYQTDARMLHVRTESDCLLALDLVDGSHALALRDGGIDIEADGPVADLHVALSDGVLHLFASTPPRRLRIQGSAIARLQGVSLNGRPAPPDPAGHTETLLIPGADWGAHPLFHSGAHFALELHAPSWV